MSKPRYKWWSYVKWMVRQYPGRIGLPDIGAVERRERDAVMMAIGDVMNHRNGEERLAFLDMLYWRAPHTLSDACYVCHISGATGRRWHTEFIYDVAKHFGLYEGDVAWGLPGRPSDLSVKNDE